MLQAYQRFSHTNGWRHRHWYFYGTWSPFISR